MWNVSYIVAIVVIDFFFNESILLIIFCSYFLCVFIFWQVEIKRVYWKQN